MPYARQAARRLRPSTRTRRRISAQFSMFVNTPVPHYSCLRWSANLGLHRGQVAVGQTKGAALFGRPSATPPGAALLPRRSDASNVRKPYAFLVVSFTLLFKPSATPAEIVPRA